MPIDEALGLVGRGARPLGALRLFVRAFAERRRPAARPRIQTGDIRPNITPEDLLRALAGMVYNVYDTPDW